MIGRVVDESTVELDDASLRELTEAGGKALVCDSLGGVTCARLVHDGARYVLRLQCPLGHKAKPLVTVRPQRAQRPSP